MFITKKKFNEEIKNAVEEERRRQDEWNWQRQRFEDVERQFVQMNNRILQIEKKVMPELFPNCAPDNCFGRN